MNAKAIYSAVARSIGAAFLLTGLGCASMSSIDDMLRQPAPPNTPSIIVDKSAEVSGITIPIGEYKAIALRKEGLVGGIYYQASEPVIGDGPNGLYSTRAVIELTSQGAQALWIESFMANDGRMYKMWCYRFPNTASQIPYIRYSEKNSPRWNAWQKLEESKERDRTAIVARLNSYRKDVTTTTDFFRDAQVTNPNAAEIALYPVTSGVWQVTGVKTRSTRIAGAVGNLIEVRYRVGFYGGTLATLVFTGGGLSSISVVDRKPAQNSPATPIN